MPRVAAVVRDDDAVLVVLGVRDRDRAGRTGCDGGELAERKLGKVVRGTEREAAVRRNPDRRVRPLEVEAQVDQHTAGRGGRRSRAPALLTRARVVDRGPGFAAVT